MVYKYAEKTSYEFLSAGGVIRSFPGYTNFPVRLGHEIFNRCLQYLENKKDIILYDPLCGSGYLVTVLGLLNAEIIKKIYGSDIDKNKIHAATENLLLLTVEGIKAREKQLKAQLQETKRESYRKNLLFVDRFRQIVQKNIEYNLFQQDLFDSSGGTFVLADIIMMDLPYAKVVNWMGKYSEVGLQDALLRLGSDNSILGITRNKAQKLDLKEHFTRLEKFKVGHRIVEIFKKKITN